MLEELIEKYGDEYVAEVLPDLPSSDYGNLESMFLYCFIRENKPKTIAEIGTEHHSRSSYLIEKALQKNGGGLHIMADLPETVMVARQNLDPNSNIKVLSGLIQETYKEQDWSEVDFLFIDADHGKHFANWYFIALIPLLKEDTPVHIHDIDLYGDWKQYKADYPTEADEIMERNLNGTLWLKKLLWLFDYTYNPEYKERLAKLKEKYPFVGEQTFDLPYKNGATYWSKHI